MFVEAIEDFFQLLAFWQCHLFIFYDCSLFSIQIDENFIRVINTHIFIYPFGGLLKSYNHWKINIKVLEAHSSRHNRRGTPK